MMEDCNIHSVDALQRYVERLCKQIDRKQLTEAYRGAIVRACEQIKHGCETQYIDDIEEGIQTLGAIAGPEMH